MNSQKREKPKKKQPNRVRKISRRSKRMPGNGAPCHSSFSPGISIGCIVIPARAPVVCSGGSSPERWSKENRVRDEHGPGGLQLKASSRRSEERAVWLAALGKTP